jgi:hypothetical protein
MSFRGNRNEQSAISFLSVFVFQNKVVHAEGAASKNIRQGIVYDIWQEVFRTGNIWTWRLEAFEYISEPLHCSSRRLEAG